MGKKALKIFNLRRKKKEVIEPVHEKKTYPKLLVENPQTAILFLQRERKNSCGLYDPFGLCTIVDCLQCENSVYRIAFDNGVCLETIDFDDKENKSEKYLLEFKDEIKRDIFEYLIDDNSDYRITRLSDNVVLRDTKEDYVSQYGHYPTVRKIKIDDTNRKRLVLEK